MDGLRISSRIKETKNSIFVAPDVIQKKRLLKEKKKMSDKDPIEVRNEEESNSSEDHDMSEET